MAPTLALLLLAVVTTSYGLNPLQLSGTSCSGACGSMDPGRSCQCNWACVNYDDCCDDYIQVCEDGKGATNTEIAMITEKLFALDVNRLPDNQYSVNFHGDRFFEFVNEDYFQQETYQRLIALLDNYIAHTGIAEPDCRICREEEDAFLDAILETNVMLRAWEFLADRGLASTTLSGFKNELKQYWFQTYSRSGGPLDSSGFEHVFLGEIKKSKVSGFHNWVQFYLQEQKNLVTNYKYIADCVPNQVTFSMNWMGYSKPITGVFFGTSPEFDMAIYTVCFVTRPGKLCHFTLDGQDARIQSYTMSNIKPMTIGTVYDVCE